jgi:hypothetical protein
VSGYHMYDRLIIIPNFVTKPLKENTCKVSTRSEHDMTINLK